jgi:hypothetical protein
VPETSYGSDYADIVRPGTGSTSSAHSTPSDTDGAPAGTQTLLLLGPSEPGFWAHITASAEFIDGAPDPIDRWSRRVIGHMACDLGAKALFPFGGPPWHPFIGWAKRSGRAWESPVGFLVHDHAGLMVSYRGALALKDRHRPARNAERRALRRPAPRLASAPARSTRFPRAAMTRRPATLTSTRTPGPIAWKTAAPFAGLAP